MRGKAWFCVAVMVNFTLKRFLINHTAMGKSSPPRKWYRWCAVYYRVEVLRKDDCRDMEIEIVVYMRRLGELKFYYNSAIGIQLTDSLLIFFLQTYTAYSRNSTTKQNTRSQHNQRSYTEFKDTVEHFKSLLH